MKTQKKNKYGLANFISEQISKIGIDDFKHQFGVSESCVNTWRRGWALPRPEYLEKIEELSGGRLTIGQIVKEFNRKPKYISPSAKARKEARKNK